MQTLLLLGQAATDEVHLTGAGTVLMAGSIAMVLGLMGFCMRKILGEKHPERHHHTPLEIDTHDTDD